MDYFHWINAKLGHMSMAFRIPHLQYKKPTAESKEQKWGFKQLNLPWLQGTVYGMGGLNCPFALLPHTAWTYTLMMSRALRSAVINMKRVAAVVPNIVIIRFNPYGCSPRYQESTLSSHLSERYICRWSSVWKNKLKGGQVPRLRGMVIVGHSLNELLLSMLD